MKGERLRKANLVVDYYMARHSELKTANYFGMTVGDVRIVLHAFNIWYTVDRDEPEDRLPGQKINMTIDLEDKDELTVLDKYDF